MSPALLPAGGLWFLMKSRVLKLSLSLLSSSLSVLPLSSPEDENQRSEKGKWRQEDCSQEEEAPEAGAHQEEGVEEAGPIPEEWG